MFAIGALKKAKVNVLFKGCREVSSLLAKEMPRNPST